MSFLSNVELVETHLSRFTWCDKTVHTFLFVVQQNKYDFCLLRGIQSNLIILLFQVHTTHNDLSTQYTLMYKAL